MMAVVFTVDSESFTGQTRVPNEEIAEVARANADVLIPFASIDPHKGPPRRRRGAAPDRRARGARLQVPPQRAGVLPERPPRLPALRGDRGGRAAGALPHRALGRRLGPPRRRRHPAQVLQPDPRRRRRGRLPRRSRSSSRTRRSPGRTRRSRSRCTSRRSTSTSPGWSPKYFPPQLVHHANTLLREQVLFGTDYPFITPERWLADFDTLDIKPEVRPLILKENAIRLLGLDAGRRLSDASRRRLRRQRLLRAADHRVPAGVQRPVRRRGAQPREDRGGPLARAGDRHRRLRDRPGRPRRRRARVAASTAPGSSATPSAPASTTARRWPRPR